MPVSQPAVQEAEVRVPEVRHASSLSSSGHSWLCIPVEQSAHGLMLAWTLQAPEVSRSGKEHSSSRVLRSFSGAGILPL